MQNVAKKLKHNPFTEMEQTGKIYLTNSQNVYGALKMIELLHINNTGYFGLFSKDEVLSQRFIQEPPEFNLMMNYLSLKDLYISVNSFYIPKRQVSYIRQINAFWVDLDYYKIPKYKNKSTQEMIEIMRTDGMFKDLEPSFYEDSGQGMYIFFLLEDIPKQGAKLWNKIEQKLIEKFKPYGADPQAKDLARILRLVGSVNSKTGRRAKLILSNVEPIRYTLRQIQEIILPSLPYTKKDWIKLKSERKKKSKEYKNKINKIKYIYNPHSLNYKRAEDIKKLIQLRANNIDGMRNTAFHMYSLFSFYTYGTDGHDKIWNSLIELNNSLLEPLGIDEIEDIYNSSQNKLKHYESVLSEYNMNHLKENKVKYLRENGCYIYSNQGIINRLQIAPNEMEQLEILIDLKEKNNRKRAKYQENKNEINQIRREKYNEKLKIEGKMSRSEQNNLIRAKIKSLMVEGFTQKEISIQLKLGIATVKRHTKYIKENEF